MRISMSILMRITNVAKNLIAICWHFWLYGEHDHHI